MDIIRDGKVAGEAWGTFWKVELDDSKVKFFKAETEDLAFSIGYDIAKKRKSEKCAVMKCTDEELEKLNSIEPNRKKGRPAKINQLIRKPIVLNLTDYEKEQLLGIADKLDTNTTETLRQLIRDGIVKYKVNVDDISAQGQIVFLQSKIKELMQENEKLKNEIENQKS